MNEEDNDIILPLGELHVLYGMDENGESIIITDWRIQDVDKVTDGIIRNGIIENLKRLETANLGMEDE